MCVVIKKWYVCDPDKNVNCGKRSCHITQGDRGCKTTSNIDCAVTPVEEVDFDGNRRNMGRHDS